MPLVRTYHSLHSKEWERTLPPVSAIKKHQSFFKPWCKRFYALHTAPLGKPKAEIGTEYPDFVLCGVLPHGLLSPSPLFLRVAAPLRRKLPFPHLQCRFCVGDFHPIPLFPRKVRRPCSENMPIFTCKLIMNLLSDFVNSFTQRWQKRKL